MSDFKISKDELNNLSKDALIFMLLQLSDSFSLLSEQNKIIQQQNEQLLRQSEDLKEQLAVLTAQRFGRKSETHSQTIGSAFAGSGKHVCAE